jgi:hypothetical protein
MLKKLNFKPGKIVYDDFDINPNIPLEQQIFSLKEDMFQVNYHDKYLIDIGWGPEFNLKGKFKIRIIKNFNWTNPIYFKQTSSLKKLFKLVEECVRIIKTEI